MIFDVKSVNVAVLLVIIGACSHPQPSVRNGEGDAVEGSIEIDEDDITGNIKYKDDITSDVDLYDEDKSVRDAVPSSVEINDSSIKGRINVPHDVKNRQHLVREHNDNAKYDTGSIEISDENIKGYENLPSDGYVLLQAKAKPIGDVTGSVEINDENIKGYIDIPSDGNNQLQAKGESSIGDVVGSVEIGDENIKGHIDLPSESNNGLQPRNESDGDVLAGSIEINDENIEGHVNLPSDDNNQQPTNGGHNSNAATGTIEIDEKNIKGRVDIPDDGTIQQNVETENSQVNGNAIAGSMEINDQNVEGHIELPNESQHPKEKEIAGTIEIDDENIQGHINIPSDLENEIIAQNIHDDNNHDKDDGVTVSIEMDDKNIQGHINIPSDLENQFVTEGIYDDNHQDEGGLNGSIEIDGGNIQGHINIPSDLESKIITQNIYEENNQDKGDEVTVNIEMDDKNIQGSINIPSDLENEFFAEGIYGDNHQNEGGINGDIEIDGENIQGHINIPSDFENKINTQNITENNNQDKGDEITGSIEMDDKNIQGHINIPSELENGFYDDNHPDEVGINGSIEIDDENIEGHVDIPSEADKEYQGNAINGSIDSNDENVEGQVDFPSDGDVQKGSNGDLPSDDDSKNVPGDDDNITNENCWLKLKAKPHLDALDKLDTKYLKVRQQYQADMGPEFDNKMMLVLLSSQGAAPRAIHQAYGNPSWIPAGINLGGYCMMRMPGSILFFHRMKLRNSTQFRVDHLSTQLMNMTLAVNMNLHDLHLRGAYERSSTGNDPSKMYYVPSFGELDILLKNVYYKMEGRLRLLNQRLIVELISSDLSTQQILLTYDNDTTSMRIQPKNLEDYLERLKADLDTWMKDYFNDYLMYFGIVENDKGKEIQQYEKLKTIKANEYADHVIKVIKDRIKRLGTSVKFPSFKIKSVLGTQINLKSGRLRGLDSIYRRSIAMTISEDRVRQLDVIVSFSKLKVEYQYEAMVQSNTPPLVGMLMLSADELTAHMKVSHLVDSETYDLFFDSINQIKPKALTIEGPANRVIVEYRHILENPSIAIMTNVLKHNIKMLKSLTRCTPNIKGNDMKRDVADVEHNNKMSADNLENGISNIPTNSNDDQFPAHGDSDSVPVQENSKDN